MEGILHSLRQRLTLHASSCKILIAAKALPARDTISFVTVTPAEVDGYRAKEDLTVDERCMCLKPKPMSRRDDAA